MPRYYEFMGLFLKEEKEDWGCFLFGFGERRMKEEKEDWGWFLFGSGERRTKEEKEEQEKEEQEMNLSV